MIWIVGYGVVAILVALAAFLLAEWFRDPGTNAPHCPGLLAVVTGLVWPLLLLGLAELLLFAAVQSRSNDAIAEPPDWAPELHPAR